MNSENPEESPIPEAPVNTQPDEPRCDRATPNEYYEKYLRALADYQNYQKRARFEADRAKEETIRSLLLDFLPIYDNFHLIAEQHPENQLFSGVKDQFSSFLAKYNITPIEILPDTLYNSALHEVMLCQEKDGITQMTIERVFRSGFMLNNKVLRSAQVGVSKPKN